MKKIILRCLFFLFVFCNSGIVNAQMVYMPDSLLRVKLTNLGFGTCIAGDSIDSSCPAVLNARSLNIGNFSIADLKGIEVFTSVTLFYCNSNLLTSLNYLPPNVDSLICFGNQLTSLPLLPNSVSYLFCTSNQLSSLPTLPPNLKFLQCGNNPIHTLPSLPSALTTLYCSNDSLTALPSLPNTLTKLDCSSNQITSLPVLPASLDYIDCYGNQLASLPALPVALTELYCARNSLTAVPALPSLLRRLDCWGNPITSLPALPSSLKILNCYMCQLTSLPALNAGLEILTCYENQLTSLPAFPASLLGIDCSHNQLTSLPVMNTVLQNLYCGYNQLTTLTTLPDSLTDLYCDSNPLVSLPPLNGKLLYLRCSYSQLVSLPALPPNLRHLYCYNSQLTSLPALPSSLSELFCVNNQLTSLPELPDSIYRVDVSDNLFLTCLPQLKKIGSLGFNNCPITCVPNYGTVTNSLPPLSGLPLCDLFNANGCNFYWNISGKAFLDADLNCLQSTGETGILNAHVNLYENGNLIQQAFTGGEGYYSFDVNNFGNYEVKLDTSNIPFTSVCPNNNTYLDTISPADSLIYDNNYSLKCKTTFDTGVWSILTEVFRPAHLTRVYVRAGDIANFYGASCTNSGGTLTVTLNGSVQYSGPAPGAVPPSVVSGSVITYNIADFSLIHSNTAFVFDVLTDTSATFGTPVCIDAVISATLAENNLLNNQVINCFTVVASFDPNDKQVYPEGIIDTSVHWLTYTIRFQNTGNAPAEHIYLLDTLDSNLDIASFRLLATSHEGYVQILDSSIARFNFPNINLPDSNSNEPLSHGYVQYMIRLKNNLAIGTQIHNTAYIYFDFNAPVVTNATSNTIDLANAVSVNPERVQVNISPVPFVNGFIMRIDPSGIGSYFDVVNALGFVMTSGIIKSVQADVSTTNWAAGIYFIRVHTPQGVVERKLVKGAFN